MEFLRESCEDEMISIFLKTELSSNRFRSNLLKALKQLGTKESIIEWPDLHNEKENQLRKNIMAKYRGYGVNSGMFEEFPSISKWEWVYLNRTDVEQIKYIDYDYWVELSGGTRLAKDAACNILNGIMVFGQKTDGFIEVAKAIKSGIKFPPMILITNYEKRHFVVLEGHLRLTAYLIDPCVIPERLQAMVGYAPTNLLMQWGLWGLN